MIRQLRKTTAGFVSGILIVLIATAAAESAIERITLGAPATPRSDTVEIAREKALMLAEIRRRVPVAIIGDSSLEIKINAVKAARSGLLPRYISVITQRSRYEFSPFAQIVRTNNVIAVSSFGLLYVFPIRSARIYYMGSDFDVPVMSLPFVSLVEPPQSQVPLGMRGAKSQWAEICPDCSALAHGTRRVAQLQRKWEGLRDPWQTNMTFVKVFNGSTERSSVAPKFGHEPKPDTSYDGQGNSWNWPSIGLSGDVGNPGPGQGAPGRPHLFEYSLLCAGTVGAPVGTKPLPLIAHSYLDSFEFTDPIGTPADIYGSSLLQAGPSTSNPLTWRLVKKSYTQSPGAYNCIIVDEMPGSWEKLGSAASAYSADPPFYGLVTANCNTWAAALLYVTGHSESEVTFDYYELWKITGLFGLGYMYGPNLTIYFA